MSTPKRSRRPESKPRISKQYARQAIETSYRLVVPWDHALDVQENHDAAALAFARKYEWGGEWIGGGRADGKGNVYVNRMVR